MPHARSNAHCHCVALPLRPPSATCPARWVGAALWQLPMSELARGRSSFRVQCLRRPGFTALQPERCAHIAEASALSCQTILNAALHPPPQPAHQVVFDLDALLDTAQRSGKWQCPVSMRLSSISDLVAEPFTQHVLGALAAAGLEERVEDVDVRPGVWRGGRVA